MQVVGGIRCCILLIYLESITYCQPGCFGIDWLQYGVVVLRYTSKWVHAVPGVDKAELVIILQH